MIENNTRKVNFIIARSLAICSLAVLALLILKWTGIFNFEGVLLFTIVVVGFLATVVPILLYFLKVPDDFLKYYMLVWMSLFIGVLGTQNGIGIYITYVLVPLSSVMYFDKNFTLKIGIVGYLTMFAGVYFNSAGKLEIEVYNWSHLLTFRNYMFGFTIEYLVVMVFIYQLVKRAGEFMIRQQQSIKLQRDENEKQKEIASFYKRALGNQRITIYDSLATEIDNFTPDDAVTIAAGHRLNNMIQDMMKTSENDHFVMHRIMESLGEYFGLCRILYIAPGDNHNTLDYSWYELEKYALEDFYSDFSEEDYLKISGAYDKRGFIYLGDPDDPMTTPFESIECGLTKYIAGIALGNQLWIPTLADGDYNAAMCFEKMGNVPFTAVDVVTLTEIVNTISLYVIRMNADRANRAKSAFLSSMSHEIRTPMNAILGMTTVALREDMNPTVKKSLNTIKSSADGLLAIINDILDFSKIESGRMEVVEEKYSTLSLVNDVYTIANARNVEKKLDLIFDVPKDMPTSLKGDMVRIKQVMVNLVNNAIKYTDQGSVTVHFACEKVDEGNVNLKFSVVDTGQGIKEEDHSRLFVSFSQVNQAQNHHKEGTGLGLAISKQLVEVMGGSIGVSSTYGKGSNFYFSIPQPVVDFSPCGSFEDYNYDDADKENLMGFTAEGKKLLLVDDNEINLMVAESLFEPLLLDITTASSGEDAVALTKKEKFDIIFMDNFMPGMNGEEATGTIRYDKSNPNCDTPIVALTADAMTGVKEKMLAAGMNDFLSKPIDMKAAITVMKKYL